MPPDTIHPPLTTNSELVELLLARTRPRLERLARLRGVTVDATDDVIQETLLAAWRALDRLHAPERFDAWLDGVCRNVCRRWARAQSADPLSAAYSLTQPPDTSASDDASLFDTPDALDQVDNLLEALERQERARVLDHALGYLSRQSRAAVELCYLEGLPQREAALRLGLTIGALEARLHRARNELQRVLNGALRAEATDCGLIDEGSAAGVWRETREWCHHCGRRYLRATFESLAGGRVNLRFRCPECSQRYQADIHDSAGLVALDTQCAIRPALKRVIREVNRRYAEALAQGWRCVECGAGPHMRVASPQDAPNGFQRFELSVTCPACRFAHSVWVGGTLALGNADTSVMAQRFLREHPRWIMEPDTLVEHQGITAIRCRVSDVAGSARLTFLIAQHDLRILSVLND